MAEQQTRPVAEQKRRQRVAEKERLEALVYRRARPTEARDPLDNRPKRWTWGGPPDGVEVGDFLSPPDLEQPISKQLSTSSAALTSPERAWMRRAASPNNNSQHRPRRNPGARRSIAGVPEDPSRGHTPTGDVPHTPARSSSFRGHSKGGGTPKRVRSNRSRAQSPCSPGQFPPSPRHRAKTPDDRGPSDVRGHGPQEKKIPKSTSRELAAESPGTPTGRSVGGTTDAEEASRLLAERRRLARLQKEQEERERQEQDRLRAELEQRRQQEAREQQEREAQRAEEERQLREEQRRSREEEERRQKEQRWKDMQEQLDREREEAVLRGQKETERKRMEREQLQVQQEQERLQRKKRIDEIMKRTRKSEADPPLAGEAPSPQAAPVPDEDEAPPAEVILLGPLDGKSCMDELSDGVQSMDVSPVSRDEQASGQDFSPVTEGGYLLLMDPEPGRAQTYPRLQAGSGVGDLNKNLLVRAYAAAEAAQMREVDA